jgi:hypothetical protein
VGLKRKRWATKTLKEAFQSSHIHIIYLRKWRNFAERLLLLLENPRIPLPFRIQTVSLRVLDLDFEVLDDII